MSGQRQGIFFETRGSEVIVTTKMRALRRAQRRLARIVPAGSKLISKELIEDRRAEARRECEDAQNRS